MGFPKHSSHQTPRAQDPSQAKMKTRVDEGLSMIVQRLYPTKFVVRMRYLNMCITMNSDYER